MRQNFIIIRTIAVIAAFNVLLLSCQSEETINSIENSKEQPHTTMVACSEAGVPDSKADLGGTSMTEVHWNSGDKIALFADVAAEFTYNSAGASSTEANFKGYLPEGDAVSAIYPYSAAVSSNQVTILATQTYALDNITSGTLPMYAAISDYTSPIAFKNLCGVIKLQLTGSANVESIVLTATTSIAGAATVDYNGGAPTLSFVDESKSITLDCGSGVQLDQTDATAFYIVAPACEIESVQINASSGQDLMLETTSTIKRNTLLTMGVTDFTVRKADVYHAGLIWADENAWDSNGATHSGDLSYPGTDVKYRLFTAETAPSACPDGWHLPTAQEYSDATGPLNAVSAWTTNDKGESGLLFNGVLFLPAYGGGKTGGSCGTTGYYWTSTLNESVNRYYYLLFNSGGTFDVFTKFEHALIQHFAVRCVREPQDDDYITTAIDGSIVTGYYKDIITE